MPSCVTLRRLSTKNRLEHYPHTSTARIPGTGTGTLPRILLHYRTLHELVFLFFFICRTDKEVFYKHSPFLTRSIEMIMNDNANVCHFKLVLLGDAAVGKSCLVVRFVRDEFFEFQEPTIGGENN